MNYLELINHFFKLDLEYSFTPIEVAIYFRLLDRCNSLAWKNPFGFSSDELLAKIKCKNAESKKAFDNARNRLKQAGLIDFINGGGRGYVTRYEIKGAQKGSLKGVQNAHFSEPFSEPFSGKKRCYINKHKPNETKEVIKGANKNLPSLPDRKEVRKRKIEAFVPPTLDEAKKIFFETTKTFWPAAVSMEEAKDFFDHYEANGWVQSKGKPIINWQAAASKWIRGAIRGEFKNGKGIAVVNPPVQTEKKDQQQLKQDIEQLYACFIRGDCQFREFTSEHWKFLKQKLSLKLPGDLVVQIEAEARKRRINSLYGSSKNHDLKLLQAYEDGHPVELLDQDKPVLNLIKQKYAVAEVFKDRMAKGVQLFFDETTKP